MCRYPVNPSNSTNLWDVRCVAPRLEVPVAECRRDTMVCTEKMSESCRPGLPGDLLHRREKLISWNQGTLQKYRCKVSHTGERLYPRSAALFGASWCFFVPRLSGCRMQVKVGDAWRWGLPIVSTSIGMEEFRCQPG